MLRVLRLTGFALLVFLGLVILALVFPLAGRVRRNALTVWWSGTLLRVLGVRLCVSGQPPATTGRGIMFVANHVSIMDPALVLALYPVHFVAKAEIRRWPVLGWLTAQSGTIFIERGRRRDTGRVRQTLATLLRQGEHVGVFPEATTSDGSTLHPFKPALLQAAADSNAPLWPVAIRYANADGSRNSAAALVEGMGFMESLWTIAGERELVAQLRFCVPVEPDGRHRRELAILAQAAIASALSLPAPHIPPEIPDDLADAGQ